MNIKEPSQAGGYRMSWEAKITLGSDAKTEHLCLLPSKETKAETSTLTQDPRKH